MSATTLQRPLRIAVRVLVGAGIAFALLYILVIAEPPPEFGGNWRTTSFGSAVDPLDPAIIAAIEVELGAA